MATEINFEYQFSVISTKGRSAFGGKYQITIHIMVRAEERAPLWAGKDQDGNHVSLSDFENKKVVLYFYPKDNTPGCTREAIDFSQKKAEFKKRNTVVIGISTQGVDSHKTFCADHGLGILLLADEGGEISKAYGVLQDDGMAKRTTVIIDTRGIVKKVFEAVNVDGHADAVLNALDDLL
ncbi:MAG TPA: peroxiredoxin [Patescibacteria group bacterium]|nr:peroxiredoxin [Patescibacteria group bacterium]